MFWLLDPAIWWQIMDIFFFRGGYRLPIRYRKPRLKVCLLIRSRIQEFRAQFLLCCCCCRRFLTPPFLAAQTMDRIRHTDRWVYVYRNIYIYHICIGGIANHQYQRFFVGFFCLVTFFKLYVFSVCISIA